MTERGLEDTERGRDPLELFDEWFRTAEQAVPHLPEAVCLATATPDGRPSARMVLLRGFDARGFVFYTNYESRKAGEIEANPNGALLFHWGTLERQVRVEGPLARATREESEAYFATRDRGSQLGAWASRQSQEMAERAQLDERHAAFSERFEGKAVPLPDFWGGYRLTPFSIEFWQGRPSRLHDRLRFTRETPSAPWRVQRLFP
jgi:pyridoxamine 5'-phosphate oxidase